MKKKTNSKNKTKGTTTMNKNNNKKNPLYVVTEKGKTVQEAKSVCDMLIKKLNLTPMIEMLKTLLQFVTEHLKGYAQVAELSKLMTEAMDQMKVIFLTYFPFVKV